MLVCPRDQAMPRGMTVCQEQWISAWWHLMGKLGCWDGAPYTCSHKETPSQTRTDTIWHAHIVLSVLLITNQPINCHNRNILVTESVFNYNAFALKYTKRRMMRFLYYYHHTHPVLGTKTSLIKQSLYSNVNCTQEQYSIFRLMNHWLLIRWSFF